MKRIPVIWLLSLAMVGANPADEKPLSAKEEAQLMAERTKAAQEKMEAKQGSAGGESPSSTPKKRERKLKADAPKEVADLWNNREQYRKQRIAELKAEQRNARRGVATAKNRSSKTSSGKNRGNSAKGRGKMAGTYERSVRETTAEIAAVKKADFIVPPLDGAVGVGDIGIVTITRIAQVHDETSVRVKVDDGSEDGVDVLLIGVDTSKMTDDVDVALALPLYFSGTASYSAVGGKRTILKAEKFDMDDYLEPARRWGTR